MVTGRRSIRAEGSSDSGILSYWLSARTASRLGTTTPENTAFLCKYRTFCAESEFGER